MFVTDYKVNAVLVGYLNKYIVFRTFRNCQHNAVYGLNAFEALNHIVNNSDTRVYMKILKWLSIKSRSLISAGERSDQSAVLCHEAKSL
jgi:hypothetical protein